MTTQTDKEKRTDWFFWDFDQTMEQMTKFRSNTKPATLPDWAVRGCFTVGVVGIIKAIGMESMAGILLCLVVSLVAFGLVIYVRLRKA